ncbi:MAG TPA: proton-conducting transporter membrane subunit [Oryzihumus sp.]|nr:proton-conducting transporter membrane subunit [Oryzihumus sp.]
MSAVVSVDLLTLAPVLAPAAGAAAVLVADAAVPRLRRTHLVLALVALALGAAGTIGGLGAAAGDVRRTLCLPGHPDVCLYTAGPAASALQLAALLGAVVTLLLAWPGERDAPRGRTAVTVSLVLAATTGATAVAAARDLGSWLVALELATLPTIGLVALRGVRAAISGAVALLTTSLVSFAMLALAAACWYTATASPLLAPDAALAANADPARRAILVLAVVLFVAGIGFKLSLVPFHAWTPEAYDGGSLPVTAFLAGASKVAALAALLVVVRAITPLGAPVLTAVAVVAALSMTLGNVMALRQDTVLRLLAWSTVSQAGWVVLPLATVSAGAVEASTAYLLAYVVATLTVFAVVAAVAQLRGMSAARTLTAYRGLLRDRPGLAVALGLGLLSLAGLPPGVLGLVAKVVALRPVVAGQLWLLALVAAANAVLGVAVYLRWLRVLLERPEAAAAPAARRAHPAVLLAVGVGALALVVTSASPQLLLHLVGG